MTINNYKGVVMIRSGNVSIHIRERQTKVRTFTIISLHNTIGKKHVTMGKRSVKITSLR